MPGLYPYFFAAYAIIVAAIIPPSMMITFSVLAAKNIRQIRQRVQPLSSGQNNTTNVKTAANGNTNARLKKQDYQLMKLLWVDVTIYCISAIPSPIYYIYAAITLTSTKTAEQTAWQNFFNYLAYQFLLYIAASTSLYTNLIVSKAVRDEFQSFFKRYIFKQGEPTIDSSSNNRNHQYTRPGPATVTVRTNQKPTAVQQRCSIRQPQHLQQTHRI